MSIRGEAAITTARTQAETGFTFDPGMCLQRTRLAYGVAAKYLDATSGWLHTDRPHPTSDPAAIPRGVPVWWTGGSGGHGHVAIAAGDGLCWSTDIATPGRWAKVPIDRIRERWGLTLVGWSEDINGVTVYEPPLGPPTRGARVDAALAELAQARGGRARMARVRAAIAALTGVRTWRRPLR